MKTVMDVKRQNKNRILKTEIPSDPEEKINHVKELIGVDEFLRAEQILETLPEQCRDDSNYLHAVILSLQKDSTKTLEHLNKISNIAELCVIKSRALGTLIEPKKALSFAKELRENGNEFLANYCHAVVANSRTVENAEIDNIEELTNELKQTQSKLKNELEERKRKEEAEKRRKEQIQAEKEAEEKRRLAEKAAEEKRRQLEREAELERSRIEELTDKKRWEGKEAVRELMEPLSVICPNPLSLLSATCSILWILVAYVVPMAWISVIIGWLMFYNHTMGVFNKFMAILPLGIWLLTVVFFRSKGISKGSEHFFGSLDKGRFNHISFFWWILYPFMTLTLIYRTYFACMEVSGGESNPISCFFTCAVTWVLTLPCCGMLVASCDGDIVFESERRKKFWGAFGVGALFVIVFHGLYLWLRDTTVDDIIKGVFFIL